MLKFRINKIELTGGKKEMIRKFQISSDLLMLFSMLIAEGSRFYNFFTLLSGSHVAALTFAVSVSLVIVYLAICGHDTASVFSVVICILLSVISYIDPFYKEVILTDSAKIEDLEKKYLSSPEWASLWDSKVDKEMRKISFDAKSDRVKKHNNRVDKEIALVEGLSMTKIIAFIFSAFIMSFCVPILTYLISHKLAKEISGTIQVKRGKEDIQTIWEKIGGNKI